jgi:hypothetical protein
LLALVAAVGARIQDDGPCASGRSTAKLTGWEFQGATPNGTAAYNAETRELNVTVASVNLDDGVKLRVYIDDDRIGEMNALAAGKAETVIKVTKGLSSGDRVRVFYDDRPLVSGGLVCDGAETKTNG